MDLLLDKSNMLLRNSFDGRLKAVRMLYLASEVY